MEVEGSMLRRWNVRYAKFVGVVVIGTGVAILALIIPYWIWFLIIGIIFILIGIYMYRSC